MCMYIQGMEKLSKNDVESRLATMMDFGSSLNRFWHHFGNENRPKSIRKTFQKCYKIQNATKTELLRDGPSFLESKGGQILLINVAKRNPNRPRIDTRIDIRFLIDLG